MVKSLGLLSCLLAAGSSWSSVPFPHRFAPQDGLVAPVERRDRREQSLNGKWRFQPIEATAEGTLARPTPEKWESVAIRIPSPWNVNAFPVESKLGGDFRCFPSYPASWERVEAGWLGRSFTVPRDWQGKRVRLHFEAVAGQVEVVVNGRSVGSHFDTFLPFELDITDAVRVGQQNQLLVGVRKSSLFDRPGPFGRRTYQGGSMWGQAVAGIWQDVSLISVPDVRIENVFVKPDLARDELSAEVTLRNDTDKAANLKLISDVRPWRNRAGWDVLTGPEPRWTLGTSVLPVKPLVVSLPPRSSRTVTVTAPAVGKRLRPWTGESPNLYGLVCRLTGAGSDTKYTRFGWRQVTLRGSQVLLNGKPIVMKGDSWHFMGVPQLTRRYAWGWFRALRDANLNAVRLHAQPYPSFYLDVADEQGILVLDETAIWASDGGPKVDDPKYWDDSQRHLRELILRDRNHPSVFGWSVSNEVMAVVQNVFHAPKEIEVRASGMNGVWAAICRELDPTREWISADGEEDDRGQLPVSVIHYGDRGTMRRARESGKPWGVGEAGPAYYGSPKQIAEMSGDDRAYLSFEDRMRGVADVSYRNLIEQREEGASYRSVFNLAWYGLRPLPLGMRDTSQPPEPSDGITFPAYVEGVPGVQPERLGPYCTTLNPGYDPNLPLYETWPLFDAIRNAQAEPPRPFPHVVAKPVPSVAPPVEFTSVRVLSGAGGTLAAELADLGVSVSEDSRVHFVDGQTPPSAEARLIINQSLASGGTVVVWGLRAESLASVNTLMPAEIRLTKREATSLVAKDDPVTQGLRPGMLYFSEMSPSRIMSAGLDGALLEGSTNLLSACNTDWQRWNGQGETVKTAMVLRSERESKPSGVAFAQVSVPRGRLLLSTIERNETAQGAELTRSLLRNMGIQLGEPKADRNLLRPDGTLTAVLGLESFGATTVEEALRANPVSPHDGQGAQLGAMHEGRPWREWNLSGDRRMERGFGYVGVWVYSPQSLDNLLLDPHLPVIELSVEGAEATQAWVDDREVKGGKGPLMLRQGWSHLLVKVVRLSEAKLPSLAIRLRSSRSDYLSGMRAALRRP